MGGRAVQRPILELRHFNAIVTLAEELSYTKAARRLGMSQSGLSRSIQDAERRLNRRIFDRTRSRVELTDAGRACVAEARLSIEHEERAIQFTKAVAHGVDSTLVVGRSQYTDPVLSDVLLSLHLPLHPNLDIQLHSEFAPELEHGVLCSRLDLALITHPAVNPRLTTVQLTEAPLHIVLSEDHPIAQKHKVKLKDLAGSRWTVFDRRVHPSLYDTLMGLAQFEGVEYRALNHVMSADEASHLLLKSGGIAFLTRAGALRIARQGLIAKPLDEEALRLDVHLAARADNSSKLVSEFVRAFVTKLKSVLLPPQLSLLIEPGNGHLGR
jgi:DNA-binding transcriptional LysR family regulator